MLEQASKPTILDYSALEDETLQSIAPKLGVDLAVFPARSIRSTTDFLFVSPAGRIRKGSRCGTSTESSDTRVSFGSAKVKKVLIETCLPGHSRGNLVALLAMAPGGGAAIPRSERRDSGSDVPSQGKQGEGRSADDLKRYVEIKEDDLTEGFELQLTRHAPDRQCWRVLVDSKSLRSRVCPCIQPMRASAAGSYDEGLHAASLSYVVYRRAGLSTHVPRRRAAFSSAGRGAGGKEGVERLSRQVGQMSVSGGSSGKGEKKSRRARGKKAMKQAIQAADLKSSKKPARKRDKTSTDKGPDPKDILNSGRAADGEEAQDAGVQGEQQRGLDKPGQAKKKVEKGGETPLCDGCGEQLASSKVAGDKVRITFREHGGERYCDTCYATKIAPVCSRCHLAIVDTVTNAMGKNWHPACLTCALWYVIESQNIESGSGMLAFEGLCCYSCDNLLCCFRLLLASSYAPRSAAPASVPRK